MESRMPLTVPITGPVPILTYGGMWQPLGVQGKCVSSSR